MICQDRCLEWLFEAVKDYEGVYFEAIISVFLGPNWNKPCIWEGFEGIMHCGLCEKNRYKEQLPYIMEKVRREKELL